MTWFCPNQMGVNLMLEKQCHKPPMTGNGKFLPPMKMVMWGIVYYCFNHITGNMCVFCIRKALLFSEVTIANAPVEKMSMGVATPKGP